AQWRARAHGHRPHRLGRGGARSAVHAGGASGQGAERRARGPAAMSARRALALLVLALPIWALALDFGFRPPRDPDDAAAAEVMRDLAQRIVPVYQDPDAEAFLANMTALQIVSGAYGAAFDSSTSLRRRRQGKPFDALAERVIVDAIYARA